MNLTYLVACFLLFCCWRSFFLCPAGQRWHSSR